MAKGLLVRYTLSRIITDERPTVSGIDPSFTTKYRFKSGTLDISWNGQRLYDFSEDGDQTVRLKGNFLTGGMLQVSYIRK
jgi:hypothetical protein